MTSLDDAIKAAPRSTPKLGEELPIFCEKCGYSLHGLPQVRCERCDILQFHCPECAHHQPINTLRPVVQRALGRLRAAGLIFLVFFKLNFFVWLLFAWVAMGVEWSYAYNYQRTATPARTVVTWIPYRLDAPAVFAFSLLGLGFGIVGRMFLLRWRDARWVGAILAALVTTAIMTGVQLHYWDLSQPGRQSRVTSPWSSDMLALVVVGAGMVFVGTIAAWPIWVGLVRAFLSPRVSIPLLEWQRSLSDRSMSTLGRE